MFNQTTTYVLCSYQSLQQAHNYAFQLQICRQLLLRSVDKFNEWLCNFVQILDRNAWQEELPVVPLLFLCGSDRCDATA